MAKPNKLQEINELEEKMLMMVAKRDTQINVRVPKKLKKYVTNELRKFNLQSGLKLNLADFILRKILGLN